MPAPERLHARRTARSARRSHRGAALGALLTALAFVLSSLFGLIHEATTRHVRCAQHGEMIDGDPVTAQQPGVSSVAGAPGSGGAPGASDDDRAPAVRDAQVVAMHGHQHCSLVSAMRESRLVPRPPAIVPAQVAIAELATAAPGVTVMIGGALYRTAPKTSPPV